MLADEKSGRLFIADSNHNRIVISTLAGKLLDVAGAGPAGEKNGSFDSATFHHPQGLALDGEKLYVADTENHLIRLLDLDKKNCHVAGRHGASGARAAAGRPPSRRRTQQSVGRVDFRANALYRDGRVASDLVDPLWGPTRFMSWPERETKIS